MPASSRASVRVMAVAALAESCFDHRRGCERSVKDGGELLHADGKHGEKAPGTIMPATTITAPSGAKAWKVLFFTTRARSTVVTSRGAGVVRRADDAPPKGGRPVGPGPARTGRGPVRRRRSRANAASAITYVKKLVERGYVVAATRLRGPRDDRVHPLLVGERRRQQRLDARRAGGPPTAPSRGWRIGASDRVIVAGNAGWAVECSTARLGCVLLTSSRLGVAAAATCGESSTFLPLAASSNGGAGYLSHGHPASRRVPRLPIPPRAVAPTRRRFGSRDHAV